MAKIKHMTKEDVAAMNAVEGRSIGTVVRHGKYEKLISRMQGNGMALGEISVFLKGGGGHGRYVG